MFAEIL